VARQQNQRGAGLTADRFHPVVNPSADAMCVIQNGRLVYISAASLRRLGAKTRDELDRHVITDFVAPVVIEAMCARIAALKDIGDVTEPLEAQIVRLDGTTLRAEAVSALTLWEGEPAYQVALREVGARKAEPAGPPERQFKTIVELLDEGVVVMRNDGYIKFNNPAARRMLGLGREHLASGFAERAAALPLYDANGNPVPDELRPAVRAFRTAESFSRQIYALDLPNGERRWLSISGHLMKLPGSATTDMLVSFSDVTTERAAVEQLMHDANHDPLTGLPNRAYVLRRIAAALANEGAPLRAVLFIDLDDLKTTNDTLGHQAGDALLRAAAARLRQAVGLRDVVGRHGGDEFVALVFGTATRNELNALVRRLRVALAEPLAIADTTIPIRASVGLVEVDPDNQRPAEEILRDADRAMYKAKRAGRGK
jgi:diguanylate cyclase (GGDEF)-like protein